MSISLQKSYIKELRKHSPDLTAWSPLGTFPDGRRSLPQQSLALTTQYSKFSRKQRYIRNGQPAGNGSILPEVSLRDAHSAWFLRGVHSVRYDVVTLKGTRAAATI